MGSERDKEARDRAEAQFQKRAEAFREGDAARAEYAAVSRAADEKTARLKSLRLAKELSVHGGESAARNAKAKEAPTVQNAGFGGSG